MRNNSAINWLHFLKKNQYNSREPALPIRANFKTAHALAEMAAELADGKISTLPEYESFSLIERLTENNKLILYAFRSCDASARNNETITPAAQWLLDNHYTVDKAIQQTKRDFSKNFLKQLPHLSALPTIARIFSLAWLYVAHSDSNFSLENLTQMVSGFQEKQVLHIGELWALPSAVRFILIENARRLSVRILRAKQMRTMANELADQLILKGENALSFSQFEKYRQLFANVTFSVRLLNRLRGASIDCSKALIYVDEELKNLGISSDQVMSLEHSTQATSGVSMGNIIKALKAIDDVDWTGWFETVSQVDDMLRQSSDFISIDFHSRNNYRKVIEKIARYSSYSELEVTQCALNLAKSEQSQNAKFEDFFDNGSSNGPGCVSNSLGYYLIGDGRKLLEQKTNYKPPFAEKLLRSFKNFGIFGIALSVCLIAIVLLLAVYYTLTGLGLPVSLSVLFIVLALFPIIDISLSLFNAIISWTVEPNRLIGYEFKEGIPEEASTLVVVPTLLDSRDSVDEYTRNLEVHYLNNPKGAIFFALVTDWPDANLQETEEDLFLLSYAQEAIERLNKLHFKANKKRFFLLHRHRLYNESQKCYMGWERKRGKLHELNLLLRGDQDTSFFSADKNLPNNIRFVMTLDSDTRLTPNSVTRLVGKLSHPINRPVFDSKTGFVKSGYSILQPRVTPSLTIGEEASFLQRVFSVNRGIDPYVFAVSDTYQDLLGEGTFTGKGLYDVDAFERALEGRIDENAVLSHDLLEGGFARTALVSDVEVIEDYPTAYYVDAARHHRWVRGDWQLLPYLFGLHKINFIMRWKMVDNLRRSLTPLSWFCASFISWCFMPLQIAVFWQIFLMIGMFIAPILGIIKDMLTTSRDYYMRGHVQSILTSISSCLTEAVLRLCFLPYTAYFMADAILRTLYRLYVSKQNLLEWRSSATTKLAPNTLKAYIKLMWPASFIAVVIIAVLIFDKAPALPIGVVFSLIWFISPLIAYLTSRSLDIEDALEVSYHDKEQLRYIARRTWLYYETFVTQDNNFLPPDNFQEDPQPVVAQRTSPTNIGVYLLAIVSARDFGWIGFNDALERIRQTLQAMEKLERYRGHFYNWYQTNNLQPLDPPYVSTVDSGNLAGHLVTLASALRKWSEAPAVYVQTDFTGLSDVNAIVGETLAQIANDRRVLKPLRERIEERLKNFRRAVNLLLTEPETATFRIQNLSLMAADIVKLVKEFDNELKNPQSQKVLMWAQILQNTCKAHHQDITEPEKSEKLRLLLIELANKAHEFAFSMEFGFLERKERRLLSIGYRIQVNELDESCYDLLASEARLSSLFAIAKGDIKVEHWFRLGRLLVPVGWKGALLSWSGSMFEYLMPSLVMREPIGSLLDQTNRLIVKRQIEYAQKRGLPWGISEAAFNARDQQMNYQYSAFGVPSLGLQRGLSRNAVIAPYASILAAQYYPHEAMINLNKLRKLGALGTYGFYDAVDFTPSRVPQNQHYALVKNYYAHHHGMSILAIANVVFNGRMRERFHADPTIEASELLLQEKAPREIPVVHAKTNNPMRSDTGGFEDAPLRVINDPLSAKREVLLLSNSNYNLLLTAKGTGYSSWHDILVTRFNAESALDQQGSYLFLRDIATGRWWSATAEPTRIKEENGMCIFTADKAEYHKTVDGIETKVEVIAAAQGDGEGRRIELINSTGKDRLIEITSYCELALDTFDNEHAHPSFSQMFIETEIADKGATIFAKRRKRSPDAQDIHFVHFVTDNSGSIREAEAETDRQVFIGRGRSIWRPQVFDVNGKFAQNQGCVMDPIAAIRCKVRVPSHKKVNLIFWSLCANNREKLEEQMSYYRQTHAFNRESTVVWTRSQVTLYQIGITPKQALDYQKYASFLIYPERPWVPAERIAQALGSQVHLWSMGISGDYPIFVLRITNEADIGVVQTLLKASEFWRSRGLIVDCVILNERLISYAQDTQRAIEWICEGYRNRSHDKEDKIHIFTIRRDQINEDSFNTLLACARVTLHAANGTLHEQLKRIETVDNDITKTALNTENDRSKIVVKGGSIISKNTSGESIEESERPLIETKFKAMAIGLNGRVPNKRLANGKDLKFWNGYGGFAKDGTYVVRILGTTTPPRPWINVISNKEFGFHISSEGAAFTWAENSRDYKITPWSNDPVVNRPGEAIYIVDRENLEKFSPIAAVERNIDALYETRHGKGYTQFLTTQNQLSLDYTHLVAPDAPVKLSRLILTNNGQKSKKLRIYVYYAWVLGHDKSKTAPFIVPKYDNQNGVLFVKNPFHIEKSTATSFIFASQHPSSLTTDQQEFIGALGTIEYPDIVSKAQPLSNKIEAGVDPCGVLAYDIDIAPQKQQILIFYLGFGETEKKARQLVSQCKELNFDNLLQQQKEFWNNFTAPIQVTTPDDQFNFMVNHWLPYQAFSCRILARAAFYQASGAYGFRDQLQDSLSLLFLDSNLARSQILNAASRQFLEGDVQHWWLPKTGAGVRTLISDDVVWLAYATAEYCHFTDDYSLLDENVEFIEGPLLNEGQHDAYYSPQTTKQTATLYDHCVLALDLAIQRTGPHGLPKILGGDWNDGLNLVGINGKGESVWLGWFLGLTLKYFIAIAQNRRDKERVLKWKKYLKGLTDALATDAWDGSWFRRGFYDDGTPLGTKTSDECKIDSIVQSWSVIADLVPREFQEKAMNSMLDLLKDDEAGIIRLFWPPFNKSKQEPGYIKAYPPGVRENGGQYTHGAIWSIIALAKLKRFDDAYRIFSMINPISHGEKPDIYRVEPYVMAADIYSVGDKRGHGGWTWYTGSAGWFYRAALEAILGLKKQGNRLFINPAMPSHWSHYKLTYRHEKAIYHIAVHRLKGEKKMSINGKVTNDSDSLILEKTGNFDVRIELPV